MSNMEAIQAILKEQAEAKQAKQAKLAEWAAEPAKPAQDAAKQEEHDELMQMCSEVSMLDLARRDTGETGRDSGGYVAFTDCPLCGHADCFRVYPDTNTCACFSASNGNTKAGKMAAGGTVLDYLQQRHGGNITEAVKELRELTSHPFEPKGKANQGGGESAPTLLLPPPVAIRASDPPKRNPVLIPGILRRGHVAVLAGKGKVGKSYSAIELAVATATGGKWFGWQLECSGRVLYIDPEIDPKSLDNRFASVCSEVGADKAVIDSRVAKWPLRGVMKPNGEAPTISDLAHDIGLLYKFGGFTLVIIDSASCFIDGDENTAGDVRRYFAQSLRIAAITGAAVLIVHHYGKAKDGDRSAADRARGSAVWLDAPDAALTITEILPPSGEPADVLGEGVYAMVLESGGIREFARMEPRHLLFRWPVHTLDFNSITEGWKPRSSERDGGKRTGELNKAKAKADSAQAVANLLAYFYTNGIGKDGLLFKDAVAASGVSNKTLEKALEGCRHFELVKVSQRKRFVKPTNPPREPPQTLDFGADID